MGLLVYPFPERLMKRVLLLQLVVIVVVRLCVGVIVIHGQKSISSIVPRPETISSSISSICFVPNLHGAHSPQDSL